MGLYMSLEALSLPLPLDGGKLHARVRENLVGWSCHALILRTRHFTECLREGASHGRFLGHVEYVHGRIEMEASRGVTFMMQDSRNSPRMRGL